MAGPPGRWKAAVPHGMAPHQLQGRSPVTASATASAHPSCSRHQGPVGAAVSSNRSAASATRPARRGMAWHEKAGHARQAACRSTRPIWMLMRLSGACQLPCSRVNAPCAFMPAPHHMKPPQQRGSGWTQGGTGWGRRPPATRADRSGASRQWVWSEQREPAPTTVVQPPRSTRLAHKQTVKKQHRCTHLQQHCCEPLEVCAGQSDCQQRPHLHGRWAQRTWGHETLQPPSLYNRSRTACMAVAAPSPHLLTTSQKSIGRSRR